MTAYIIKTSCNQHDSESVKDGISFTNKYSTINLVIFTISQIQNLILSIQRLIYTDSGLKTFWNTHYFDINEHIIDCVEINSPRDTEK